MIQAQMNWNVAVLNDALHRLAQRKATPPNDEEEWRLRLGMAPELSAAELSRILDAAFWASLRRFEQRELCFTIAPWEPGQLCDVNCFEEDYELSADAVASLAPCSGRSNNRLLVRFVEGQARVWGLGGIADHCALVISCDGPGRLRILVAGSGGFEVVGVVEDGQLRPVTWASTAVFQIFDELTVGSDHGLRRIKTEVLALLAAEVRRMGAGGTFVFVNGELPKTLKLEANLRFKLPKVSVRNMMSTVKEQTPLVIKSNLGHEQRLLEDWKTHLRSEVKGLAHLSTIDGAVVCDHDFRVLGFGAKLNGHSSAKISRAQPFGTADEELSIEAAFKGTRHQSAARFVAENLGRVVVLVISHDGPATLFGKDPHVDAVRVVTRIEVLLA